MDDLDRKLTEEQAAQILDVCRQTLVARRKRERKGGKPCVPPFTIENGQFWYLESEVLKAQSEAVGARSVRQRRPYMKRPAGHVSQRQAIALTGLSKGTLDRDYSHGRTFQVSGTRQTSFYLLAGLKAYLVDKPDRLMPLDQTAKALATTQQRLADHIHNTREGYGTLLHLPFETFPSGAVGFRLSAVLNAAEVLFQHAEE